MSKGGGGLKHAEKDGEEEIQADRSTSKRMDGGQWRGKENEKRRQKKDRKEQKHMEKVRGSKGVNGGLSKRKWKKETRGRR